MDEILAASACEAVALLQTGKVSARELCRAAIDRINAIDSKFNAVPTLCADRALAAADNIDQGKIEPADRGWLAGLPIVVKDLHHVAGVKTTFGSPIFKDHVSVHSSLIVERLEQHGAVVIGKSNTPEFGAGANTFNEVFGITRNPFDPARTPGGSSGGSAAALATGMAFGATGTDLGGSLRTPAAFCNVVGLRPSPARVPRWPSVSPFQTLDVDGPMARNVTDLALLLDAMAGADPRDPLSYPPPDQAYSRSLGRRQAKLRLGYSPDLGGITPIDPAIRAGIDAAIAKLDAEIDTDIPDFSTAPEIFQTLRAGLYVQERAPLLASHRDLLKPDVIWNIEKGEALNVSDIASAERSRAELIAALADYFENHDLLVSAAAIVPPFPVEQRFVAKLGDHQFESYIDWLSITFAISITGCPAMSLPCGFDENGLPMGLQLIGPPRGEAQLLAAALQIEQTLNLSTPSVPDTVWDKSA